MPLGSDHLTLETPESVWTYPGQAHFAVAGAKNHCFECVFWDPRRSSDKLAICRKAAQMLGTDRVRKVPRQAFACRYFEKIS
jgi:hypothetical protein